MVLDATFNNISVISLRSASFVEETGGPEKTTDLIPQVTRTVSHNVVSSTPCHERHSNPQVSGDKHM